MIELSSKKTSYIIIAGTIVLLFLSYHLSFKKSWLAYSKYKKNLSVKEQAELLKERINQLKATELTYNSNLIKNNTVFKMVENRVLEGVIEHAPASLNLEHLEQGVHFKEKDILIETASVTTEGTFQDQLVFLNSLEQQLELDLNIRSIDLVKELDFRNNKELLKMTVYVQELSEVDK